MRERKETHPEAIAFSVEEAARRLAVGRSTMYQLIRSGEVATSRFGRRTVVPASELSRVLSAHLVAAA
ncbi:helix-turn-helix domain-containing protein [Pseudoxanthomonas daejeonensis]|uniref:helix-turn-helix domain-containing protein n=1 Tax=Pseudoxanthomonas daejeonensis TaxID=266062 RepID=UPI003CE5C53E